jgi:hypothetical protein
MKNIHLLPTDKPSRILFDMEENYYLPIQEGDVRMDYQNLVQNRHIYITSDSEIKEGVDQWYLDKFLNKPRNSGGAQYEEKQNVIILTTDPDLISDGVQPIDDDFLEWFVKNPSCEEIEAKITRYKHYYKTGEIMGSLSPIPEFSARNMQCKKVQPIYEIIIPQKEPKQETLEEAMMQNGYHDLDYDKIWREGVQFGTKWQAERMYTYDELRQIAYNAYCKGQLDDATEGKFNGWIQQFKKK